MRVRDGLGGEGVKGVVSSMGRGMGRGDGRWVMSDGRWTVVDHGCGWLKMPVCLLRRANLWGRRL